MTETQINPTSADDKHVRIEGRLGLEEDEDGEPVNDTEHYAFGFIYTLGVLSFADASRGASAACTSKRRTTGPSATCFAAFASSAASFASTRTTCVAGA